MWWDVRFALNDCAEKLVPFCFHKIACVFTCEHNFIYGFSYRYHNHHRLRFENILLIKIHLATIFTFVTHTPHSMCGHSKFCLHFSGKPWLNLTPFSNFWTLDFVFHSSTKFIFRIANFVYCSLEFETLYSKCKSAICYVYRLASLYAVLSRLPHLEIEFLPMEAAWIWRPNSIQSLEYISYTACGRCV